MFCTDPLIIYPLVQALAPLKVLTVAPVGTLEPTRDQQIALPMVEHWVILLLSTCSQDQLNPVCVDCILAPSSTQIWQLSCDPGGSSETVTTSLQVAGKIALQLVLLCSTRHFHRHP